MAPHIARRFRTASRPLGALAAVLALTFSSLLLAAGPARAGETPTTAFSRSHTAANGLSSTYHLRAHGIDHTRPVGVAFYFDGDGQYWAQRPDSSVVRSMARHAAARNMVLVVPVAPDRRGTSTWWENIDANGDWFRSLAAHLVQRHGLNTADVWLAGHSGGAQFITKEVLADRQNWIRGGGAVVIGGGGARDMQTAPSRAVRSLPVRWVTGADDVAGATEPASWSALADARSGQRAFARAGFTRTGLRVPARTDHHAYDHAAIFSAALTSARNPGGHHPVVGGIAGKYRQLGGAAALGEPVMAERGGLALGGAYQEFVKDGRKSTLYWTPRHGTHLVQNHGAIGRAWIRAGREHVHGMPVTDEIRSGTEVRQRFSNGSTVHWSSATGRTWVTG